MLTTITSQARVLRRKLCLLSPSRGLGSSSVSSQNLKKNNNGHQDVMTLNEKSTNLDHFDFEATEKIVKATSDFPVEMENPYKREGVKCLFCRYNVQLDYKNVRLLSQFVSSFTGNVYDRHITRLCQKQQDQLVKAIRLSRKAYYMPKLFKKVEFMKDPKLFDPNNPIKPNPF